MYSLDLKTRAIVLWLVVAALVIATPVLSLDEEATSALSRNEALNSQLDILASDSNGESDSEPIFGSGSGEMDPLSNTGELLDNPEYFEGDLNIPREQFMEAYHPPAANVREKRGAINERRWPGGIINYDFDLSVSSSLTSKIMSAITVYERETCLRFRRTGTANCIQFTTQGSDCSSDSIGRKGGIQTITLPSGCQSITTIIHEIGHAIGLWHEQSRPDRDLHVNIHLENVQSGRSHNFEKRQNVDYQGEPYDYRSIMHYTDTAFGINGRKTITPKESSNSIAPSSSLSSSDIKQINRMYTCPEASPGYKGALKVRMIRAWNLPDTDHDWWWNDNDPDPYAVVVAVDKTNYRREKSTGVKSGTTNPQWNQELDFGNRNEGWRYFTITIYDSDNGGDDKMVGTQTIWVYPSCSTHMRRFCYSLTRCVDYSYRLEDVNNCNPNPCVRGTCQDRFCDYYCSCPRNYSGKRCDRYNPPRPPRPPSSGGTGPIP